MRDRKWLIALAALTASGLIAAGCGGDDEPTTAATGATETTEGETTTVEESSETASPDDVYNACLDAIEGTPAEDAGQTACEQARDTFAQCTEQAENAPDGTAREIALQGCQAAADAANAALEAGG